MGYVLQGVIAPAKQFEKKPSNPTVSVVALKQDFALVPIPDDLYDQISAASKPSSQLDGREPRWLDAQLLGWLELLSVGGAVGYVETDFFGGVGAQRVCVVENGRVVLGPLETEHFNRPGSVPVAEGAINVALRFLGVMVADGLDEFDALGLGRYRQTEDWLEP